MEWKPFHHPDLCLPVIRRRVADELLHLLIGIGGVLATRGRSLMWNDSLPDRLAYNSAMYRLRQAGLIAYRRAGGRNPVLVLTEKGKSRLPDPCKPQELWRKKWNGIWYVLVYDVPEKERPYRESLRGFLTRMRMGCLQRSVWVTPHDIRPEYDDLAEAAAVQQYSFLFESRTVLGRSAQDVVNSAWDFDRLDEIQRWYCDVYTENLHRLLSKEFSAQSLMILAREEMSAYLSAMNDDPLLPLDLWPSNYCGKKVYSLHRKIVGEIGTRL